MPSFLSRAEHLNPALYDSGTRKWISYGGLRQEVERIAGLIQPRHKALVFCFCPTTVSSIVAYLGALASRNAVALLDSQMAEVFRSRLIEEYQPEFVFAPVSWTFCADAWRGIETDLDSLALWAAKSSCEHSIHPDLAVLLSTSGVTGSPKMVRLSSEAVHANAASICRALAITERERAITGLPLHYSYGLSVLNSHLLAGASVVVSDQGLTSRPFWDVFRGESCTSLAGVPYSYQMLMRLGIDQLDIPSLRTLTQAGGKLQDALILRFHEKIRARGGNFYVMYGQTEATARIAVLPPELLPDKVGSVGFPVHGGRIEIEAKRADVSASSGEIVYHGANVMMGYACNRSNLALGDSLRGRLETGDLGYRDADGLLYVTGRTKRFAKVFGLRINLDEIEDLIKSEGAAAVVEDNNGLVVFCEFGEDSDFHRIRTDLSEKLNLHPTAFQFRRVDRLPLNANGKVNYRELAADT